MINLNDDFIMLPTVDVCFKGLMENPKVRKGFVAAILGKSPDEIEETTLIATELPREHVDDKLGVLDVRVRMKDKSQINMEMQVKEFEYWDERILFYLSKMFVEQIKEGDSYEQLKKCIHVSILDFIRFEDDKECYRKMYFTDSNGKILTDKMELQFLELKKLSENIETEEDVLKWMKFFSGKSKEEFENMSKENEYLDEAYNTLVHMSEDEKKRLEYEARQKAIRDHNAMMSSAERQGMQQGIEKGKEEVLELINYMISEGRTEEISRLGTDEEFYQQELQKYLEKNK